MKSISGHGAVQNRRLLAPNSAPSASSPLVDVVVDVVIANSIQIDSEYTSTSPSAPQPHIVLPSRLRQRAQPPATRYSKFRRARALRYRRAADSWCVQCVYVCVLRACVSRVTVIVCSTPRRHSGIAVRRVKSNNRGTHPFGTHNSSIGTSYTKHQSISTSLPARFVGPTPV